MKELIELDVVNWFVEIDPIDLFAQDGKYMFIIGDNLEGVIFVD